MGRGAANRLAAAGFHVVAYDPAVGGECSSVPVRCVESPRAVAAALTPPRIVVLLVPAGDPVDQTLFGENGVVGGLAPGDVVIDAGNSYFRDSLRRAARVKESGIHFIDCGTSGGIGGEKEGYCLMIGGDPEPVELARPVFEALAAPGGWLRVGGVGSGHYTKMVHNAIEYAMLEAIGEGFELLKAGPLSASLGEVARLWTRGSVIRGWLMELAAEALSADPELKDIRGEIGGGSTGRWAIDEAWDRGVPLSVIALSYSLRHRSRQRDSYAGKVVAALRHGFGGHEMMPALPDGE